MLERISELRPCRKDCNLRWTCDVLRTMCEYVVWELCLEQVFWCDRSRIVTFMSDPGATRLLYPYSDCWHVGKLFSTKTFWGFVVSMLYPRIRAHAWWMHMLENWICDFNTRGTIEIIETLCEYFDTLSILTQIPSFSRQLRSRLKIHLLEHFLMWFQTRMNGH